MRESGKTGLFNNEIRLPGLMSLFAVRVNQKGDKRSVIT